MKESILGITENQKNIIGNNVRFSLIEFVIEIGDLNLVNYFRQQRENDCFSSVYQEKLRKRDFK